MEYDFVVVGSGFGGSVSALRLAEKGYKVAVVEQGRSITHADIREASKKLFRLLWIPSLGMDGFFSQTLYKHLGVVGGVGVGGGSLVYAAVLLEPRDAFYKDPAWGNLGIDWKEELEPHYKTAASMLGIHTNPSLGLMDDYLKELSLAQKADNYGPTPNGIYFGTPEVTEKDPYFEGDGPSRSGCYLCGECLTGCHYGSKNTLDKNYLYLAQKFGAEIIPERKVTGIYPQKNGGFLLKVKNPLKPLRRLSNIRAKKVVLAAGVLGTLDLLFKCKKSSKMLPNISDELGKIVRTNSESIVAAIAADNSLDMSKGTTISSHYYPDDYTHITQNRFPIGYSFMRWYFGPMVNHEKPIVRRIISLIKLLTSPVLMFRNWFGKNWHKRTIVLTVMQHYDNKLRIKYGRSILSFFFKKRLKTKKLAGKSVPTNIVVANQSSEILADKIDGKPLNNIIESIGNLSITAHILGGCHMGSSRDDGVIDTSHRLFEYPDIYVVDGSSISANVGVNPSLTIAALAERAMSHIEPRES